LQFHGGVCHPLIVQRFCHRQNHSRTQLPPPFPQIRRHLFSTSIAWPIWWSSSFGICAAKRNAVQVPVPLPPDGSRVQLRPTRRARPRRQRDAAHRTPRGEAGAAADRSEFGVPKPVGASGNLLFGGVKGRAALRTTSRLTEQGCIGVIWL